MDPRNLASSLRVDQSLKEEWLKGVQGEEFVARRNKVSSVRSWVIAGAARRVRNFGEKIIQKKAVLLKRIQEGNRQRDKEVKFFNGCWRDLTDPLFVQ